MAASRYKTGPTGPSQAARTRDLLMEEDRIAREKLERERTLASSGKKSKRHVSTYRFEVYRLEPRLVKREQAHGATDLKAKKKAAVQGLPRGSYRVKVFNESTGKGVR